MSATPTVFAAYESRDQWTRLHSDLSRLCDFARFLEPEDSIRDIVEEVRAAGLEVQTWEYVAELVPQFVQRIGANPHPLLWNLTDGHDHYRGSHLPALAQLLKVPHLGSGSYTQMLCQNKQHLKAVAGSQGVAAVPGLVIRAGDRSRVQTINGIRSPYFVKPNRLDNGIGDTLTTPICPDTPSVWNAVEILMSAGIDEVLVEQFLPGDEYTVIAAESDHWVTECARIQYAGGPYFNSTVKDAGEYACESADESRAETLVTDVLTLATHIGLHDYFRADFRCDSTGQPYLLEVNSNPFLACPFFDHLASRRFASRSEMLSAIIRNSYRRQAHYNG